MIIFSLVKKIIQPIHEGKNHIGSNLSGGLPKPLMTEQNENTAFVIAWLVIKSQKRWSTFADIHSMAEFVEGQEKENTEKALQNFALLNGRAKFHLPCLFTKFLLPTWPQRSNATIYGCCYIFIVVNSISFNSLNYLLSTLATPETVVKPSQVR